MSAALQLGPVALSWTVLLVLAAFIAGHAYAAHASKRCGVDLRNPALGLFLLAVVVARLSFVWSYRQAYLDAPLGIFDIRDGGWDPQTGIIAAWVCTLVFVRARAEVRKPLVMSVGIASAVWIAGTAAAWWMPRDETRMPALALSSFDGSTQQLLAFEGKPTVINLWATWCPPCRREMPVLEQAQRDHAEVHFVFLNQKESARQVEGFLRGSRLTLHNVLLDPKGEAGARFGVTAFPTTLFFDASGRLVDQRLGELSKASLAQKLRAIQRDGGGGRGEGR